MEENIRNAEQQEPENEKAVRECPEKNALGNEELEKTVGGALYPDGIGDRCKHPNKVKTGAEREDSRFIFWSQHQFQYFCPDCKKYIWVDEER